MVKIGTLLLGVGAIGATLYILSKGKSQEATIIGGGGGGYSDYIMPQETNTEPLGATFFDTKGLTDFFNNLTNNSPSDAPQVPQTTFFDNSPIIEETAMSNKPGAFSFASVLGLRALDGANPFVTALYGGVRPVKEGVGVGNVRGQQQANNALSNVMSPTTDFVNQGYATQSSNSRSSSRSQGQVTRVGTTISPTATMSVQETLPPKSSPFLNYLRSRGIN